MEIACYSQYFMPVKHLSGFWTSLLLFTIETMWLHFILQSVHVPVLTVYLPKKVLDNIR